MTFKIYFLLFIIYSIIGWIIEVLATFKDNKCFVNRGFLIGPYCPIYGVCAILMLLFLPRLDNIFALFVLATLISSIVEYMTSYVMEKLFKARWWDYSNRLFNINGRICLKFCLAFGLCGVILLKYLNPCIANYLNLIPVSMINILFYLFLLIFIIDVIISFNVVMKIKDTLKFIKPDNTKEITDKVRSILNTSFLTKRLLNAFPNFKIMIKDIERKIRGKNEKKSNR